MISLIRPRFTFIRSIRHSSILTTTTSTTTNTPTILASNAPSYARHVQAWIRDFKTGRPKGLAQLDASIFAAPIRIDIMHRVIVYTLAQKRGISHRNQKTRAEVQGSSRKVRQQKGAGRARVGDRKSPLFKGGGRAFPRKTRDFRIGLQRKVRDFGMRSALSSKYAQGQLMLVSEFGDCNNSKMASGEVGEIMMRNGWLKNEARSLVVVDGQEAVVKLDGDLAEKVTFTKVEELSVYDILCNDYLFITKEALKGIEKRYHWY